MSSVVDSHQHFWRRSRTEFDYRWLDAPQNKPISGDRTPEMLEPIIRSVGVSHTVCVQTQHKLGENDWALGLADLHPFIAGVVGWVDLGSHRCEEQLLNFRKHRKAVGIRHVVQDEPDADFIIRPENLAGLKVLEKHKVPFDLLFHTKHLQHAAALGKKFPNLPMVIDHLGKPSIKAYRLDDWVDNFRAAAACPNIYCKLSGMVTEADWTRWTATSFKPYVQEALESFGPDRLMFGSDWPVCEVAGTYEQVFHALIDALGPISETEHRKIFGDTAKKFYNLAV